MSRSWREVVVPLKQAHRSGTASSKLAIACLDALADVSLFSLDVRGEDAINDLIQLAQGLSGQLQGGATHTNREQAAAATCCRLLSDLLQQRKVAMPIVALSAMCPILRSWADESSTMHGGPGVSQPLQNEALKALAAATHESAAQLVESEREAVLALLVSMAAPGQQLAGSVSPSGWRGSSQRDKERGPVFDETQRLALQALGGFCTHASPSILQPALQSAAAAVMAALEAWSGGRQPLVENMPASRFYNTLLRTLHVLLFECKKEHGLNHASLVEALRKYFIYGALPGTAASRAAGSRREDWDGGSSESEASDSEGSLGTGDRFKSSRVRLAALNCLQVLAKADGKALHPHWTALLPVHTPLSNRPGTASLMDVVVNDPLAKVRATAAATVSVLLEGAPQRAYLAIAEAKSSGRQPVRGFTTLSSSLGQMSVALHEGLFHAISIESHLVTLTAMLRTICTLLGTAPYPRLPPNLLPRATDAVRRCLGTLQKPAVASPADLATVQAADQLLELAMSGLALVRVEAVSALRGLATNYPATLGGCWPRLSGLAAHLIQLSAGSPRLSHSGAPTTAVGLDERAAQQAIRLLGDFLQASSGCADLSTNEDEAPLAEGASQEELVAMWADAWASLLPKALRHGSAAVRAAGHAVTTALTQAAYQGLNAAIQQQILESAWTCLQHDPAAPVRAAAAKALGALVTFTCLLSDAQGCAQTTVVLAAAVKDSSVSVRIMAAWAVANLANAMLDVHHSGGSLPAGVASNIDPMIQASLAAAKDSDKWNACYALGNLLRNPSASAAAAARGRLAGLLLLLLMMVRDNAYYKIRTHAAAAFLGLRDRQQCGDMYGDAVCILCASAEALDGSGPDTAGKPPAGLSPPGGMDFKYRATLRDLSKAMLVSLGISHMLHAPIASS
ncbi:hypothetical protein WJX72_008421 [[Myrmecia] bisecta]|uniref:DUF4042 domain-containing protein n=1 Tax=[Myrmecia] bisecta TaxID=41462 RepID=A0AAW1PCY1_9CHLO